MAEPLTQAELHVLAPIVRTRCQEQNLRFLACKGDDANPAACVERGHEVTACVHGLAEEIGSSPDFIAFAECLEEQSFRYEKCQKQKAKFQKLVEKKSLR